MGIYFIALKHLQKNNHSLDIIPNFVKSLHPSVPARHSDLDVVIVDMERQKFALDVTIGSYQDLMDLHCF